MRQPTLMELVEPLGPLRTVYGSLVRGPRRGEDQGRGTDQHRAILEAIRARRPAEAHHAVVADIRATSERYQKFRRAHAKPRP